MKKWCALSSFTGTEIILISETIKPDKIITNNKNSKLKNAIILPNKPSISDYDQAFDGYDVITLHGWNRIIPDEIVEKYMVYNCHPGDIVVHPCLIGADPQKKAIDLNLKTTGVIIHRATKDLDQGPIIARETINITTTDVDTLTSQLRHISINMWLSLIQGLL